MKMRIYDESYIKINELIGRKYSNPLGESFLRNLARLIKHRGKIKVLDLGCGRGASLIFLAKYTNAKLIGIDPADVMIRDARKNVSSKNLSKKICLFKSTIDKLPLKKNFDLIFSLDVLGFVKDRKKFLRLACKRLKSNGLFILSNYFVSKPNSRYVRKLCNEWQIKRPPMFESYKKLAISLESFSIIDTTKKYYEHWKDVKAQLKRVRKKAVLMVGITAVQSFERKIDSIIKAVKNNTFGHLVVFAKKIT